MPTIYEQHDDKNIVNNIKATVLDEYGHEAALLGLMLSHYDNQHPVGEFFTDEKLEKATKLSRTLAHRGGGHSSFLKQIGFNLLLLAPRYFWVEMDTYKVGTSMQSASTMHVLAKRKQTAQDFTTHTSQAAIENLNDLIEANASIGRLKANVPEGLLQLRVLQFSYMSWQNVVNQRRTHRLTEWATLIHLVNLQLKRPELINHSVKY